MAERVIAELVAQLRLNVDSASFREGERAADALNQSMASLAAQGALYGAATTAGSLAFTAALSGMVASSTRAEQALGGVLARSEATGAALGNLIEGSSGASSSLGTVAAAGARTAQSLDKDVAAPAGRATASLGGMAGGSKKAVGALAAIGGGSAIAGAGIVVLGALAAKATVDVAVRTAEMASAVQEQVNGVKVTFGEASDTVTDFAQTTADAFGISERAALQAANRLGGVFKAFGVGRGEAAALSKDFVALAGDLASFKDIAPEEALTALSAGLVGEAEPLRRLGVTLSEATVQAKAFEIGIARQGEKLTDQQKILARVALIQEQTTDAQGDAARTSGSLANQQRQLSANFEELGATIGAATLPLVNFVVKGLNIALDAAQAVFGAIGNVIGAAREAIGLGGNDDAEERERKRKEARAEAARNRAAAADKQAADSDRRATAALDLIGVELQLTSAEDSHADAVTALAEAETELADILYVRGDAARAVASAARALADADERLVDAQGALRDATENAAEAEAELAELQATEAERAIRLVERATLDLERARKRQKDSVADVAAAEKALAEARASGASPNEIRRREEAVEEARLNARDADLDVLDAGDGLTDAQRQQREGTDELVAGQEAFAAATRSVEQAHRGVEDAARASQDATAAYNEELANVGPNSQRAVEAQEAVDDAHQRVTEAADALARQEVVLGEKMAEVEGRTFTARDALEIYRIKLGETKTGADELLGSLEAINRELTTQQELTDRLNLIGSVADVLPSFLGAGLGLIPLVAGTPAMPLAQPSERVSTGMQVNGPITVQAQDPAQFGRELTKRVALQNVGSPP